MSRVALFIDYQNVYMRARDSFAPRGGPSRVGQIVPRLVGELLVERGHRVDPHRVLSSVLIARGVPSAERSPIGDAAAKRQVAAWGSQSAVTVVTHPLQYVRVEAGPGVTRIEAREKGVDVVLAVQMLLGAQRDEYDVAILFSADSDLIPAVVAVRLLGKRCEVAAWRSPAGFRSALRIPGVWRHWLDRADYERLHDPTDYTKVPPTR